MFAEGYLSVISLPTCLLTRLYRRIRPSTIQVIVSVRTQLRTTAPRDYELVSRTRTCALSSTMPRRPRPQQPQQPQSFLPPFFSFFFFPCGLGGLCLADLRHGADQLRGGRCGRAFSTGRFCFEMPLADGRQPHDRVACAMALAAAPRAGGLLGHFFLFWSCTGE